MQIICGTLSHEKIGTFSTETSNILIKNFNSIRTPTVRQGEQYELVVEKLPNLYNYEVLELPQAVS
jgi:hypothetical protein